jgi:hypothetical protein
MTSPTLTAAPAAQPSTRDSSNGVASPAAAFNAGFLREMIVCETHWCAMQIATLALMTSVTSRPGGAQELRSCRHLLHDDMSAMLLALRYAGEVGLSPDDVAKLSALYRGVGAARKSLAPLAEPVALSQSQRILVKSQSANWRRLAAEALVAISQVEASTRQHLNGLYAQDSETLRQYLRRAADGDLSDVDGSGVVHPPELKQRRRSPRIPLDQDCELILPTGTFPAKLRDVSREGLSVLSQQPLGRGQKIVVQLADGRKLDGFVVRAQGGKVGVSLSRPLATTDPLLRPGSTRAV